MSVLTLLDSISGSQAKILPQLGFNLFEFSVSFAGERMEIIEADPDYFEGNGKPSRCGIPILFPFPNRIAHGKFSWEGKEYQLPANTPGDHCIHGFCLDRPWRVTAQTESSVTAEFQLSRDAPDRLEFWPADFLIECTYLLQGSTLKSRFRFTNPDNKPLPWGFGTHAYFRLPISQKSSPENCVLYAPVYGQWPLKDFIPTGEIVPPVVDLVDGVYYTTTPLDDVFTDLRPEGETLDCVIVDEGAGYQVVQSCDKIFRELVVYTPADRAAVCMEPYTCPTDAINLEAEGIACGWRVLPPGESFETWIDIRVEPILA